ncbi:undecaprenyl/decaprenyl-phosphate alpha-N-acetylglucosaminyl 1-phosphate transferase [Candidatus Gracilibacteria bacterium 28_42_T64]|nr:undecaprenyl/decaprenyl-phosphate alpha-N-acetylglucosaminyl 1-phosphate transferase [Candidatus Gracilibacteria bacterium 28_42_T64]
MGIVFFISFFIVSFFATQIGYLEYNFKLGLIWVFGFFITAISFMDDMLNVSPKVRLAFQVIIGAIIGVTSIKIGYISNIFGGILNLETYYFNIVDYTIYIIPLLFTVVWYVFIFNALNWTDGIQGNTSGLSIISFSILFALGIILFYRDDYEGGIENAKFIMGTSIILVGILIPFWYFDFKERILMGDSGTMFLGFMLATLAIIAGGKIATVLVVFGIYTVDTIYVLINRVVKKKSLLAGDFTHLHHRLLDLGLARKQVLYLIYSLSFLFGLTALFLDRTGKIIVFGIIIVVVVFINKIVDVGIKGKSKLRFKKSKK